MVLECDCWPMCKEATDEGEVEKGKGQRRHKSSKGRKEGREGGSEGGTAHTTSNSTPPLQGEEAASDAKLGPKDTVFVRQYCKVEGLYVQNVLSYYGFEVPKGTVFITFGRRSHSKTIQ